MNQKINVILTEKKNWMEILHAGELHLPLQSTLQQDMWYVTWPSLLKSLIFNKRFYEKIKLHFFQIRFEFFQPFFVGITILFSPTKQNENNRSLKSKIQPIITQSSNCKTNLKIQCISSYQIRWSIYSHKANSHQFRINFFEWFPVLSRY